MIISIVGMDRKALTRYFHGGNPRPWRCLTHSRSWWNVAFPPLRGGTLDRREYQQKETGSELMTQQLLAPN